MRKRVLILRSGAVDPDPRVEKYMDILSREYDVCIYAFDKNRKSEAYVKEENVEIKRIRGFQGSSKLSALFSILKWNLVANWISMFKKYDIVHCCDFDTYLLAFFPAKIRCKKIIYDVFDFYADNVSRMPRWVRSIIAKMDLFLTKFTDLLILADTSRIDQMKADRVKQYFIFYNTPKDIYSEVESLRSGEMKDKLSLIYVGLVDFWQRGFDFFIDVLASNKLLDLTVYGSGSSLDYLKEMAQGIDNLHVNGKIPYKDVLKEEAKYDMIFAVYDPKIPTNVLASPNKYFEGLMLGVPVLINEEVRYAGEVNEYNVGLTYKYGSKESIANVLDKVLKDRSCLQIMSENCRKLYKEKYDYTAQSDSLLAQYQNL